MAGAWIEQAAQDSEGAIAETRDDATARAAAAAEGERDAAVAEAQGPVIEDVTDKGSPSR